MKKYTILLMLCLAFGYVKAQTILVNSNVISVQEDVTFPFWLNSMSTIEIGTQVVSISALEFNIVAANNGNSLVFSQTKTITSQETVPNGMTWKITAVLLDSTAINNSSSGGGGQVIVSGSGGNNFPVAVSEESPSNMNFGNAMIYCDSLQENGFDDWVIPTFEELVFVSSGGVDLPGNRSDNHLWTAHNSGNDIEIKTLKLETGMMGAFNGTDANGKFVRCVRHESISVSGSGSSSGGSNTTSGGGGGNMPVALSEESPSNMIMGYAMLYCDSLQEDGYDNWVLPTLEELMFVASGGGVLPGVRTSNPIWTSSVSGGAELFHSIRFSDGRLENTEGYNTRAVRCVRHESISVSGSGSSSGGSNTASTLGSGMPTMISNEQPNMEFPDGVIYCETLIESGYDDWVLPTFEQLTYALTGGCNIPDTRTTNKIITRTNSQTSSDEIMWMRATSGLIGGVSIGHINTWGNQSGTFNICVRCVR